MKRREFLASSITFVLSFSKPWARQGARGGYEGLSNDKFFSETVRTLAQVPDTETFTEGPAVAPDGSVYFTNIPTSRIYRWEPSGRKLSVFREESNKANGLTFNANGDLLVCEQELGRITQINLTNGESRIVVDNYRGDPLEAPNDLIVDSRGRIYFSSRPTSDVPSRSSVNAVYRVDPDGTVDRILEEPEVQMPNGLALAPDEQTLYLIEAHPDESRNRHIRAYPLDESRNPGKARVLYDFYPGRSGDGMCVDSRGNLYVAAGLHARRGTSETLDTRPGVHVLSPSGRLLAFAQTPVDTISNCTFGGADGKTLFITCGPYLQSTRTKIRGV